MHHLFFHVKSLVLPSGGQTWQLKLLHLVWFCSHGDPLKQPFIEDVPLPRQWLPENIPLCPNIKLCPGWHEVGNKHGKYSEYVMSGIINQNDNLHVMQLLLNFYRHVLRRDISCVGIQQDSWLTDIFLNVFKSWELNVDRWTYMYVQYNDW